MPIITVKYQQGPRSTVQEKQAFRERENVIYDFVHAQLSARLKRVLMIALDRSVGVRDELRDWAAETDFSIDIQTFHPEAYNPPDVQVLMSFAPGFNDAFLTHRDQILTEVTNLLTSSFPVEMNMTFEIDLRFEERSGLRIRRQGGRKKVVGSWGMRNASEVHAAM